MTSTYVTTVPMNTFSLAPVSPLPRLDLLDLIIRVLIWLLALAISLKGQPACCDKPKLKPQEQGYSWCVSCGAVFDDKGNRRPYNPATYYADIDRSLRAGYNLDWMSRPSGRHASGRES